MYQGEDIKENIAARKLNIIKGFIETDDILEKAVQPKQVGQTKVGSDGVTRVWTQLPNGKYDWRRKKASSDDKKVETKKTSNDLKLEDLKTGQTLGFEDGGKIKPYKITKIQGNEVHFTTPGSIGFHADINWINKNKQEVKKVVSVGSSVAKVEATGLKKQQLDDEEFEYENSKKDDVKSDENDSLISNTLSEKEIDVEDFLKKLNTSSESLSKDKNSVLDNKILFTKKLITNFSGSYGVPNPKTITTYHFSDESNDESKLKSFIADKKKDEREHLKKQKKEQDNHDYRFQRPSTSQTEYGVTTLRKVMKDFEKRQKSFHGTMSSSKYEYKILKNNQFKKDEIKKSFSDSQIQKAKSILNLE
jgi:hypothetical protein